MPIISSKGYIKTTSYKLSRTRILTLYETLTPTEWCVKEKNTKIQVFDKKDINDGRMSV